MNIAIVDDNEMYAKKLTEGICAWAERNGALIQTQSFKDSVVFLAQAEIKFDYDVLVFDVSMPQIDGIELARKIRELHPFVPIIFVSDYMQFSPLGYEVNAVRYLNKAADDFTEKLDECLKYVTGLVSGFVTQAYTMHSKNSITQLPYKDILYFEARNHKIHIFTLSKEHSEWRSMSELIPELPDFFVQSSRSYMVNVHHIVTILPNELVLTNNSRIPLSRTFKNLVSDRFIELK